MNRDESNDVVLRVNGVSRIYRVWNSPADRFNAPLFFRSGRAVQHISARLGASLIRHAQGKYYDFTALESVSFELKRGESLGVIGPNGAGKSTLLQIIAGTLAPTTGSVETQGVVAALLELGSGFNPEFTGRENVYVNGAILGLARSEIARKYEDIVNFADIGDFIEQPVKFYSTGMQLRLAFAVQVHLDPDILIVDEALAVGDAQFQAKAMAKIDEILERGTSLLYVGHDLNAVKSFCSRALRLDKGKPIEMGDPETVTTNYLYDVARQKVLSNIGTRTSLNRRADGFGIEDVDITRAEFDNGSKHRSVRYADELGMLFELFVNDRFEHPYIIVEILDSRSLQLAGRRIPLVSDSAGNRVRLRITMKAVFQQGIYRVRARIVEAPIIENTTVLCRRDDLLSFDVVDDSRQLFIGLFPVPMQATWENDGTT
jgi:lipopolysaccharide transport system ATP-binding protein